MLTTVFLYMPKITTWGKILHGAWDYVAHFMAVACIITLGAHAQRGYGSWVVCLSVCLSGLYLAGRAFIRSTNDATYLAGNEVGNFCAILSETSPLQSWSPTGIVYTANIRGGHFSSARYAHAHNILRPQSPGVLRLVSCYFHCQSCLRARSVQNVKLLYQ